MLDKVLKLWKDIQDESVTRESIESQISELLRLTEDAGYIPSETTQMLIYAMVEEADLEKDLPGFLVTLATWVMLKKVSSLNLKGERNEPV